MLDEHKAQVDPTLKQYPFTNKTVSQRIVIASAGPISNFLFAFFAYWLMFLSGFNVLIPTIGSVDSDSIASVSGLQSGYEISAIDCRETQGWRAVSMELLNRIGDTCGIQVKAIIAPGIEAKNFSLQIDRCMVYQQP